MAKLLIHAWPIQKKKNQYYLPYTHWVYLKEIVKYYEHIVLLSSCEHLKDGDPSSYVHVSYRNVSVYELPHSKGYLKAIKFFFEYRNAYKKIADVTTYYTRYPIPFGWLQKVYGKQVKRIIHYVGDPIDATENNPNFGILKKKLLISSFRLEDRLYDWACKGAKVFTNGHHIAEKLGKKNIIATPLISSTLSNVDFFYEDKIVDIKNMSFIYLGYLRKAKGVETIIKAFGIVQKQFPNVKLTIIGTGEFESSLKSLCVSLAINNVTFFGHIDDRSHINSLLRKHDIFLFGSLSEGSPRVVLEAMANGLLVISTPVGSLPTTFEDKEDILFSDFNNEIDFGDKILSLTSDINRYNYIRKNAFEKVKKYTIENFIKRIFYET